MHVHYCAHHPQAALKHPLRMKDLMLWLVLKFWYISLSTAQDVHTYYVTPNSTAVSCGGYPCNDLNTYSQNKTILSLSNMSLIFLPGVHHLNMEALILFQNAENVQLLGSDDSMATQYTIAQIVEAYGFDPYSGDDSISYFESPTTILCGKQSGILFANITNLKILNLTLLDCGAYSSTTSLSAGVHLVNISNFIMDGVSIRNSTGYGLVGVNVLGQSQVTRSSFVGNNQYLKSVLTKVYQNGFNCDGNLYSNISMYYNMGTVDSNSATGGNTYLQYNDQSSISPAMSSQLLMSECLFSLGIDGNFMSNYSAFESSSGTGLSIYSAQSTYNVSITISQTTFYRNQAVNGANFYLKFNPTTAYFTISNIMGTLAIGLESGILIQAEDLVLSTQPTNTSVSNFVMDSTFKCNFFPTTIGTAISIVTLASVRYVINFYGCNFEQSSVNMAAVYTVTDAYFDRCNFTQTSLAVWAQYNSQPYITITRSIFQGSNLIFDDNYATRFTINMSRCDLLYSRTSFLGYLLKITVYLADITLNATSVHLSNSFAHLNNDIIFVNCLSNGNGGALAVLTSTVVFEAASNVVFMNNTAVNGGALFMDGNSLLNLTSPTNVSFIGNTAILAGGAIHVLSSSTLLADSAVNCFVMLQGPMSGIKVYFEGNRAGEAGSMLYGGDIGNCKPPTQFRTILIIGFHDNASSLIASEP